MPKPPDEAFAFFGDAHNLEDITPPWLGFRVVTPRPIAMRPGTLIEYRLRLHGLPLHWRTQVAVWDPPRRFVDVQLRGPYRLWHHTHEFEPEGDGTRMTDVVRYGLPLGPLGEIAQATLVGRDVEAIFDHRARAIPALLDGQHR
ncbi:MAG: SRPBCC family protein [Thermoleophilaceae bacterium]